MGFVIRRGYGWTILVVLEMLVFFKLINFIWQSEIKKFIGT